jgi:ammonium transporter Rh
MTFLRKYEYSAIGFTLLIVAFTFQWALMVTSFFQMADAEDWTMTYVTQTDLIVALYGVITVLISFGSVLGIVSSFQLLIMAFFETILYGINLFIIRKLQIYNSEQWTPFGFGGDATAVHVFGAYFGLAMAIPLGLRVKRRGKGKQDQADSYSSDMFAMIGTIFLWVLWPSFNAALAPANTQHRVIINTVLALCASVVFAFLGSRVFRGGKFDMTDIQNATLAGGVGIGNASAIVVGPGSALIIGAVCAVVSTLGYAYLSPLLQKVGVYDTRGVHNGHGLPGIIGALSAIVSIAIAFNNNEDGFVYGQNLNSFFALGQPTAAWQLLSLIITLVIALVGGLALGFIMYPLTKPSKRLFTDIQEWRVPADFEQTQDEE